MPVSLDGLRFSMVDIVESVLLERHPRQSICQMLLHPRMWSFTYSHSGSVSSVATTIR